MRSNFRESLSREGRVDTGSNRGFGLVMGGACLIIAGLSYWPGSARWPYWAIAASAFAITAWLGRPSFTRLTAPGSCWALPCTGS